MKPLMKPENEAEANVIKSVFDEHGIYAEIRSFHDTAYDGLFQSQYGWGLIRVSEADFDEAQRIVKEWKDASPDELPWKKNRSAPLTAAFGKEDKTFATRNDIKYFRVPKPGNVLHKKKGFMRK